MKEKENAVIIKGKKYRVLTRKKTIVPCKDCDLDALDMCVRFCVYLEDYLGEKDFVYFKEVKE